MELIDDAAFAPQTEAALGALEEERKCLERERAAFDQFRKHVVAIDADPSDSSSVTAQLKNATTTDFSHFASKTGITKIWNGYRETVMSVAHYEDDYGHSLEDDLAMEFGPELATALSTADSLTAPLKETLLSSTQQASESRAALLNPLNREAESIQRIRTLFGEMSTTLAEMNRQPLTDWSQHEIYSGYDRLQEFETQCDELAADRQAELRSQRVQDAKHYGENFNEYLYKSLSVTYPVLADIAEIKSLLQTARRSLERVLIN